MHSAKAVANFFLARIRPRPSQLQLHKLLYLAHGWHLGGRGEPLLDEMIQAWEHGPVVPSLLEEFRDVWPAAPIPRLAHEIDPRTRDLVAPRVDPAATDALALLERIREAYGHCSAARLAEHVREAGSPWLRARAEAAGLRGATVPNERMAEHFGRRLREAAPRRALSASRCGRTE